MRMHYRMVEAFAGIIERFRNAAQMASRPPPQRLRRSLAGADGRLDIPSIEERCAALVINAKGVLHFYMDLYTQGWKPESFGEMMRNWAPFESYKTNQLLAEAQYVHHFIDVQQVTRSFAHAKQAIPDAFEEAMRMANCATFVHYIHQLPTDPSEYGRRDGRSITVQDVVDAPLRSLGELRDARRVFLRSILPFDSPITDEVLNMLLDLSIQIFIHRLERVVQMARAGELDEERAKAVVAEDLSDLMSGDVVRHTLQQVRTQRRMTRAQIERAVQRYETFSNMQQIVLQDMLYDYSAMMERFSYQRMSADLTSYVRDVVREVDAGMHSTTLPQIISRLTRESSTFSSSDLPDHIDASSSIADGRLDDGSSIAPGPSQSTPKAAMVQPSQHSQPFASQYVTWLDQMMDDNSQAQTSQRPPRSSSRLAALPQPRHSNLNRDVDLSTSQKLRELEEIMMEEDTATEAETATATETENGESDVEARRKLAATARQAPKSATKRQLRRRASADRAQSVDFQLASSPPRAKTLGNRFSAALTASGRGRNIRVARGASVPTTDQSQSDELDAASRTVRRHELPDSPSKQKASRLGFDSQNRLVRRQSTGLRFAGRMLDGTREAVRESRFDSQGEDEEDVFLDRTVKSAARQPAPSSKGKQRAVEPNFEVAVAEVTDQVMVTERLTRSRARNRVASEAAAASNAIASEVETEERPSLQERQTARRTGTRSSLRNSTKQESLSPAKARASRIRVSAAPATPEQSAPAEAAASSSKKPPVDADVASIVASVVEAAAVQAGDNQANRRQTRSRAAQVQAEPLPASSEAPGLGRGRPNGSIPDADRIRFVSTVSGRLVDPERIDGEEAEESWQRRGRPTLQPQDVEMGAPRDRATPEEGEEFAGDDDPTIQARRAARDAALADRQPRPGILSFPHPAGDNEAPLLFGVDEDPLGGMPPRDVNQVRAILRETDAVNHRRIGPYRPEQLAARRRAREENDPVEYDEEEMDELQDEGVSRSSQRAAQRRRAQIASNGEDEIRVEPYKGTNLYITGHNMTGRQRWTQAEVECLLSALHRLARYKKIYPKFKVYSEILKRHGMEGTDSRTLERWNNVQLKDKSRNELIRMKREGVRIPYWKRLLHPNIWEPKKLPRPSQRDMTEDVPDIDEESNEDGAADSDQSDGIEDADQNNTAAAATDEAETSAALALDRGAASPPFASLKSSNPLRNDP
ncbi:hypothetical protein BCV70DRAFT_232895 [Testicularia cyperi]|uniref:Uncharacterized protein n=1 Tax=Testicularia cyperi TaxID=1882483 RepID=A0A317XKN0_9BASI|nr:hypothetical protein BCV70DRAFT_232895 [Testicularia cyperi]